LTTGEAVEDVEGVQLEDNVVAVLAIEDLLEIDNVGVLELAHDADLLEHLLTAGAVLVDDLHRKGVATLLVLRLDDDGEGTTAKELISDDRRERKKRQAQLATPEDTTARKLCVRVGKIYTNYNKNLYLPSSSPRR